MTHRYLFTALFTAIVMVSGLGSAMAQEASMATKSAFEIPTALKAEHEKLHHDLSALTKASGSTGEAAKRVATALHAHFGKEEELAMPPLGLIAPLAEGRATPDMRSVVALTDQLKAELPQMLSEHRDIVRALDELRSAAEAEHHADGARFAEELTAHAQTEEAVLYPAAILVGEYLKLKFPR